MFWGFKVKMCTCKLFYGFSAIIISVTQKATTATPPYPQAFQRYLDNVAYSIRQHSPCVWLGKCVNRFTLPVQSIYEITLMGG